MKRVTLTLLAFLAVICGLSLIGQWMLPEAHGQASRVNVHMYSIESLKEDSSASATWVMQGWAAGAAATDADTSQEITAATYTNFASAFHFGVAGGVAGGESLSVNVIYECSFDAGVTWTKYDSIQVTDITLAKVIAMSLDTTLVKKWTLPPHERGRIIINSYEAIDRSDGWNITIQNMKQQ